VYVVDVTQLRHLNCDAVAELCRNLFPHSLQLLAHDEFAYRDHLPEQWIEEFWQYLARWFPDSLSPFEGLHLLPNGSGNLLPLDSSKAVVVLGYNDCTLPDDMREMCGRLGVRVVEEMMRSVCNRPDVWGRFILRPDAEGVLTALSQAEVHEVVRSFSTLSVSYKASFREFVLSAAVAKPGVISAGRNILRVLPMFSTLPTISDPNGSRMVSLNEVRVAGHSLPFRYPEAVMDASGDILHQLLPAMNVQVLSVPDCLTRFAFPAINNGRYSDQEVEDIMKFVCEDWRALSRSGAGFVSRVKEVRFVARMSGYLVTPSDLFDPDDSVLTTIFRGQDVFRSACSPPSTQVSFGMLD